MQQSLPKQSLHNFERFPAVYQGETFRHLVYSNMPPLVLVFILMSSFHNLHLFAIHISIFLPSTSRYSGQVHACIFDLSYLPHPCTYLDIIYLKNAWWMVESSWNVMAHGDAREGKWWGNCRMAWVASTLHTTSEHCVSIITTADAAHLDLQ
jgi:hypothetical protein